MEGGKTTLWKGLHTLSMRSVLKFAASGRRRENKRRRINGQARAKLYYEHFAAQLRRQRLVDNPKVLRRTRLTRLTRHAAHQRMRINIRGVAWSRDAIEVMHAWNHGSHDGGRGISSPGDIIY
jgi:hypothetical protein